MALPAAARIAMGGSCASTISPQVACLRERAPDGDRAVWRKWAAASWNALQCKMLTKAINLVQFLGKEQKKE